MSQTKEEKNEYNRAYGQTPAGVKSKRISQWKRQGIISDDYDALHDRFMATTHCEKCSVLLTAGLSRTGKCLDHDHSINDRENFRAVLCSACNLNDQCTNTSGVPNVHYCKANGWKYKKTVNRVIQQKYFKTKEEAICYKYEYELELEAFLESRY